MENEKDKTMFFHGETKDGQRVTLAGLFVNKNPMAVKLGISVCMKNQPFERRFGRARSKGRLEARKRGNITLSRSIDARGAEIHSFIDLCKDICSQKSKDVKKLFNLV